ncbi:MAG TPA: DNA repair protein RadC [Candidatus Limnocylindria bacterium]|nr:DNA repair protein RadC [Candidatus Limnocylindria bacterium]
MPIREWPEAIRPRERLIRDGPPALSDAQLLALLIGSGTARRSALAMAEGLLHSIGGAGGLARADLGALGLGPATAARVVAALELGRRALAAEREGDVLDTPAAAARVLAPHLAHRDREAVVVALLTRKQRLIAVCTVYEGNVAGTSVRIGELFTEALRRNAAGIVLAHNHPSGDPEPSADDLRTTRDAVAAGRLLGVSVVDHLIVGAGRHVSLRERGAVS